MTTTTFQVPPFGPTYVEHIFQRCRDLIAFGVWAGIEPHRLDAWIGNFRTAEEKYLCARILDFLVYRSNSQTLALSRQLFQRTIPDIGRENGQGARFRDIYQNLKTVVEPGVRLIPVIPPNDPPIKSGVLVARNLEKKLRFQKHWIGRPDQVATYLTSGYIPVFIDDFLGTGTQFAEFLQNTGLESVLSNTPFVYAPLVAHIDGVNALRSRYPHLLVGAAETLDENHALFDPKAEIFPDEVNSEDSARDFYYDLLKNRGIDLQGPDRRGYGHFELAYAFEHAVPDNSLPLLWWPDSPNWRPLFDR